MAKKEQCLKCKGYNESQDLCTHLWLQPTYDETDCDYYHDSLHDKKREAQQVSQHIDEKVAKEKGTAKEDISVGRASHSSSIASKSIMAFAAVIVSCVAFFVGKTIYTNHLDEEEKKDAMMLVKFNLEGIKNDRTTGFSTLSSYVYENDTLSLVFDCSRSHIGKSTIYNNVEDDFMAVVTTTPEKWLDISKILSEVKINLSASFPAISRKIVLPYDTLYAWVRDTIRIKKGNDYFAKYKMDEVVDCAKKHFANDRYFSVEGYSVEDDCVLLNLSYYDVNTKLGETFYDKKRVPLHFTDKVDEMGTLLDGMLDVCTRIGKGLGFTYTGTTKHEKYSCIWTIDEIPALMENERSRFLNDQDPTNQVSTVIVHDRKK